MIIAIGDLKLSVQRALLGNVFPELRAVCVNSSENLIYVCFYCDGEVSEDNQELYESAVDQITADFSYIENMEIEISLVSLEYPKKTPLVGHWVYYRHEM